jgi:signal transduction histidine kinase
LVASPLRVAGAIAQLSALAFVGPLVFAAIFSMLGTGIGMTFVIGLGLLILIALVYVLFAVAWLENARVDGLYGFGLPRLAVRRPTRSGFGGVLHMFWRQAIDQSVWRAIANFAISTILGVIVLFLLTVAGAGIFAAFSPLYATAGVVQLGNWGFDLAVAWAPLVGPLLALAALAATVGLAVLHGVLSRLILVPSREAQLAAEAREAGAQRAGAIRASEVERTRIERDLHDGVQPRLVSVGMTLGLARQKIDDDPAAAKALVEEAHTSTKAAITELRQLARGIHASVLDDRGLDAALSAVAARSHVPVHLDVRIDGRCGRTAEAAAYFAIAESLTNAAKHSRASNVRVVVRSREDGSLWARVEDDGLGGARILPGGGLDGIANRIAAAGGTFRLDSPNGGPTALEVSVPCAS